jgi:hypothetical protein
MQEKIVEQRRWCFHCQQNTSFELTYLGKYLKSGRCSECDATFNNRSLLLETYVDDKAREALQSSVELYEHLGKRKWQLVKMIPALTLYGLTAISRPYKELKNLRQILS